MGTHCCCHVSGTGSLPYHCLPSVAILGAQKAGSTALLAMLMQHPDARAPLRKELHFWDTVHAPQLQNPLRWTSYLSRLGAGEASRAKCVTPAMCWRVGVWLVSCTSVYETLALTNVFCAWLATQLRGLDRLGGWFGIFSVDGLEWMAVGGAPVWCDNRAASRFVVDATPSYILSVSAPELVHTWLPGVKTVVVLRNPVDRAYSECVCWHVAPRCSHVQLLACLSGRSHTQHLGRPWVIPPSSSFLS